MIGRAAKVFLAIVALTLCTGAAFVGYRLYRHPELRGVVAATTELIELRRAGERDPGARAMRDAGCAYASAVPSAEFARLLQRIDPAVAARTPAQGAPGTIVECRLEGEDGRCDEIARAYVGALERPPVTFAFTVETDAGTRLCQGVYSQSGRRVREIVPGETPQVPDAVSSASRRPTTGTSRERAR